MWPLLSKPVIIRVEKEGGDDQEEETEGSGKEDEEDVRRSGDDEEAGDALSWKREEERGQSDGEADGDSDEGEVNEGEVEECTEIGEGENAVEFSAAIAAAWTAAARRAECHS